MIVEIDESMFARRKNHAERVLPQQWLFGGICRQTNDCFIAPVGDRSAATLLDVIKDKVAEGSVIYSDSWKGYKTEDLMVADFDHWKVNHLFHFVDRDTGVNTQKIERLWGGETNATGPPQDTTWNPIWLSFYGRGN